MRASFFEKLVSGSWRKAIVQENISDRSHSAIRDLPDGVDYRQDALVRTKKEKAVADSVAQKLLGQYPDLEWHIEKLRSTYHEFADTGIAPRDGFYAFRHLYFATQGVSNQVIATCLGDVFPKPSVPAEISSIFGTFDQEEVRKLVGDLRRDGICKVGAGLDPEQTRELAASVGFWTSGENPAGSGDTVPFSHVPESKLLATPIVVRIASDPLFHFVASEYLETEPILLRSMAWISRPHNNSYENLDTGAQLFHVDMNNPKFLDIFIYLNDVDIDNGPHCMIPGTHREKAQALWRDGRISNEEMASSYPPETWRTILGPPGTVFIVDTSVFHKGIAPVSRARQVCSFTYINTLFGEHLPVSPEAPRFHPGNFGPQVADFSPRFLSRFAMGF